MPCLRPILKKVDRLIMQSRSYDAEGDFHKMREFLIAARSAAGHDAGCMHVGDLTWWMYQNTIFDPARNVRLWEADDGELLGFAWFSPPATLDLQIHPQWRGSGLIEREMLDWAGEHRRDFFVNGESPRPLTVAALKDDSRLQAVLERRGFQRARESFLVMMCDLTATPLDPSGRNDLKGLVVRHITDESEYEERVSVHRDVWNPSKVTTEAYRQLRNAPGYEPELDLVAATPEGKFLAYCICWIDTVNRVGEFEPVGTREAARRQGLGKAVVREGQRRLKSLGAQTALVYSKVETLAFYEACGFEVVNQYMDYTRE